MKVDEEIEDLQITSGHPTTLVSRSEGVHWNKSFWYLVRTGGIRVGFATDVLSRCVVNGTLSNLDPNV